MPYKEIFVAAVLKDRRNMSSYKVTHIPYGISDPSKRTIRNPGFEDEVEFKQYGIETGGEYFMVRTLVQPGGGMSDGLWSSSSLTT